MSDYHPIVVKLKNVSPHPNADSLFTADAGGYPVVFKSGQYVEGDLVAYIPIDSIVPDTEEWSWLGGHRRIKAKKLRGIYSMGLVVPVPNGLSEGDSVMEALSLQKYEADVDVRAFMNTDNEKDPGFMPCYTDIESLRRYKSVLLPSGFVREEIQTEFGHTKKVLIAELGAVGEEVVITEKIHGANARYCWKDGRMWAGSRSCIKAEAENNMWWSAAENIGLREKLATLPDVVIYGEVFGQVQDLKYGKKGFHLAFFDAFDIKTGRYFDYDDFDKLITDLKLTKAPVLYRGPWSMSLTDLAEGTTVIGDGANVIEGFVVKPVKERYDDALGRVILKMVGQGYTLRKGG